MILIVYLILPEVMYQATYLESKHTIEFTSFRFVTDSKGMKNQ